MNIAEMAAWKNETNYLELKSEAKCVFELIDKYHDYFSKQDKKYRMIVRVLKITVLALAMLSTVILGLKTVISIDLQIVIGLMLSALITFTTAISSYFNFEEYWMRNIAVHIELNILRDDFMLNVMANKIDEAKIEQYRIVLTNIQLNNKKYWESAIKKI